MSKPNILYIHSHDTGRYIQPYGFAVPTPNMQRFAEQGVTFRNAFSVSPKCSPSRAGLLMGLYPHQCGIHGVAHRGWGADDYSRHIVNVLREQAGYFSKLIGIQHVIRHDWADRIGYDEPWDRKHGTRANAVTEPALAFLKDPPKQPWFCSIGFAETHRLAHKGKRQTFVEADVSHGDSRYVRPPLPLPDTPQTREDFADFIESAKTLDAAVGRILDQLDASGQADNTLVLLTTDHGLPMPHSKDTLYDGGIGVYMMMRGPGHFTGGRVIDPLVSHLDFYPTVCDLLEIDRPAWLEGESLLPLVQNKTERIHDHLFAEYTVPFPLRAVFNERYKYIRRYDPLEPLMMGDSGLSQTLWLDHGYRDQPQEYEALYDGVFDPHERNNLVDDPRAQPMLATLRDQLDQWMERTDDRLRFGEMPTSDDRFDMRVS